MVASHIARRRFGTVAVRNNHALDIFYRDEVLEEIRKKLK